MTAFHDAPEHTNSNPQTSAILSPHSPGRTQPAHEPWKSLISFLNRPEHTKSQKLFVSTLKPHIERRSATCSRRGLTSFFNAPKHTKCNSQPSWTLTLTFQGETQLGHRPWRPLTLDTPGQLNPAHNRVQPVHGAWIALSSFTDAPKRNDSNSQPVLDPEPSPSKKKRNL